MKINSNHRISLVAKKVAAAIVNMQPVDKNEILELFNEKDSADVIERLENPKSIKERQRLVRLLKSSEKEDWELLINKIQPKHKFKVVYVLSKIAAIFIVSLSVFYYFINGYKQSAIEKQFPIEVQSDDIILELDNGIIEVISNNGQRKLVDDEGRLIMKQKGALLDYKINDQKTTASKVVYNELHIPYGKTFKITLSDGTKVHMNAGSSLKYPIQFIEGKKRQVYLTGEAYFEVTKDPKHPFIVSTDKLNIRVLGTSFNVSSYKEDNLVNTVLLEGAISLYAIGDKYKKEKSVFLKPGRKACWAKGTSVIKIKKVDTSVYTSWRFGKIVFKHMQFKNILKKLERHYNVKITNTNEALSLEKFTATFDIETIEQVLESFNKNYNITYVIENGEILIN